MNRLLQIPPLFLWVIAFPLSLFSLEKAPWFSDVYEFHLLTGYTYSDYSSIDRSTSPASSRDHRLATSLESSPSPQWSIDGDVEFVDTTRQSWSFQSIAVQGRYLWLDDMIGDLLSLATGLSARITSRRSLKDVSCPYHGFGEFLLHLSFGREFDPNRYFRYRFWGYTSLGFATSGSPWLSASAAFEGNYQDLHKGALFLDGGHGYGKRTKVDPLKFFGYGRIRYKFLDLGLRYGYQLGVAGTIRVQYKRRLLAGAYPEGVNFWTVSYLLPFSF